METKSDNLRVAAVHHKLLRLVLGSAVAAIPYLAGVGPVLSEDKASALLSLGASVRADMNKKALTPDPAMGGSANEGTSSTAPSQPRVTQEKFKDWSLQCVVNSAVTPSCQIMYQLMSSDQKQVVLVLSVAMYAKNSTRLQMALPLGFSIPPGVHVAFGKGYSMEAKVSRCTVQGCLIEGEGPAKMIGAMQREKGGTVTVHNMQGSAIQLPISLDGFSAAYDALKAKG